MRGLTHPTLVVLYSYSSQAHTIARQPPQPVATNFLTNNPQQQQRVNRATCHMQHDQGWLHHCSLTDEWSGGLVVTHFQPPTACQHLGKGHGPPLPGLIQRLCIIASMGRCAEKKLTRSNLRTYSERWRRGEYFSTKMQAERKEQIKSYSYEYSQRFPKIKPYPTNLRWKRNALHNKKERRQDRRTRRQKLTPSESTETHARHERPTTTDCRCTPFEEQGIVDRRGGLAPRINRLKSTEILDQQEPASTPSSTRHR